MKGFLIALVLVAQVFFGACQPARLIVCNHTIGHHLHIGCPPRIIGH